MILAIWTKAEAGFVVRSASYEGKVVLDRADAHESSWHEGMEYDLVKVSVCMVGKEEVAKCKRKRCLKCLINRTFGTRLK